jgi:hypothetical protein
VAQVTCNPCAAALGLLDSEGGTPVASKKEHVPGGRRLYFSLVAAALLSWLVTVVLTTVLMVYHQYSDIWAFVALHCFFFLLSWYFAYDTQLIEERSEPHEYMHGVVCFWGDMVLCIFCSMCMAMMMK